jgi:hypothetical protein
MVLRLSDAVLRATDWAERGKLSRVQLEWCAAAMATTLGWTAEKTAIELADARATLEMLHVTLRDAPPVWPAAVNS